MRKLLALLLAGAASAGAAELKIRNVVLYKHGVGYFERGGELARGESARLDFRLEDMNDILKSLTLEVAGGKGVAGLRYDSHEPLERKLSQFSVRLDPGAPLAQLLDQLRGAALEVRSGSQAVTGTIVSARTVRGSEKESERQEVILLLPSGELKAVELPSAASLRFPDPKLQGQLRDYLEVLSQGRSKDRRSVYIDSDDSGARQIVARYMAPSPVWKSSYRLVFPVSGEPLLEGWAIIDNTSGEDWTNIRLAVVSGRPVSFVSQLYPARYVSRPVAQLPEEQAAAPQVHAGGLDVPGEALQAGAGALRAARDARMEAKTLEVSGAAGAPRPLTMARPSTAALAVAAREAGELFEYAFSQPISVRKDESAMLPFLQQKLGARKLLLYNDTTSAHPRNAAELTNSTGKTLDGGPITVFDGDAYAGEALVETLKAGDKRLISYAVDLGTRVTTAFESDQAVLREIHLRRGILTTRSAVRQTTTYTIQNVDQKPKTLLVERTVRPGFELIGPKPVETTRDARRFEVKLAAGASQKLPVVEENLVESSLMVTNLTPDQLASYVQNKEISPAARQQLEKMLAVKRDIAVLDREMRQAEQDINELFRDQERIRQNLGSLRSVAGQQEQIQKYARELADQELKLASLRDRAGEVRKKKTALEQELAAMIEKMEF